MGTKSLSATSLPRTDLLNVISGEQLAEIVQTAKRERAVYVAALLKAALERIAAWGGGIRQTAAACTAARLSRS